MDSADALVRMRWWNLLFLHWPVPVDMLRPLVPAGLEIDTFDGTAWIGLIPFSMSMGMRYKIASPLVHRFDECNVRTYVKHERGPGVWFFSLDATSRLAVWGARRFWHLDYRNARIDVRRERATTDYTVRRLDARSTTLRCRWRSGEQRAEAQPGALDHFLTERYLLYAEDRASGALYAGAIRHAPWPLREAEVLSLDDELVASAGVAVEGPPIAYHADSILVDGWSIERLGVRML